MIENWDRSKELLARARQSLAGGVSSPFRARAPVPLYFEDGCGPRLRDVDGNEYIDYQLAWGPMILGYKHPKLVEAMRRQALAYRAQSGTSYFADLAALHAALGLTVGIGDTTVMASLTPVKEKEVLRLPGDLRITENRKRRLFVLRNHPEHGAQV